MIRALPQVVRRFGGVRRANDHYRPGLDGIRAIAVVAVLLYHGLVSWSQGGFLGVDVFFVLSGYLITSLLLSEWHRWGSVDLVRFYVHRARRLLPALVLVVLAIAGWAALEAKPDRLGTIRADGVSALLYVANWRFVIARQSYFDQYGDPSPFRHMWSLAIEEQYYLMFPLILIGLLRLSRRRRWLLPAGLASLTVASIVAMATLYDSAGDPSRVYYGTDTRIHELLIGSLLAVGMTTAGSWRTWATKVAPYGGGVALAGVLAACTAFTDHSAPLYLGGFAGVCLVSALLIASVELAPRSPVGRLLSVPPVAWIGAISYGLYLWHWPVYIALNPNRTGLDDTGLLLLRLGATLVIASASYYLVERPIRGGSLRQLPARLGRILASVAMPVALVGLIIGTLGAVTPPLQASPFGPGAPGEDQKSLLVVGDSVGLSLAEYFPKEEFPRWAMQDSTSIGCGLAEQYLAFDGVRGIPDAGCDDLLDRWRDATERAKPQAVLLSVGAWEVVDHVIDDETLSATGHEYAAYLTRRLGRAVEVLSSTGARVFIPNVPCYQQETSGLRGEDIAPVRNDPARGAAVNAVLTDFAAAHPDKVTLIDVDSWLCPGGNYQAKRNGAVVRYDGVHYSKEGAAMVWRDLLIPPILRASNKPPANQIRALMVGDSVPLGLTERFPRQDYPDFAVASSTQLGCSTFAVPSVVDGEELPLPKEDCQAWERGIPRTIEKYQPDVGLVMAGTGEEFDKQIDGDVVEFGTPEHDEWLSDALRARVDQFLSRDVPVILLTSPCHQAEGVTDIVKIINDDARVRANNEIVTKLAASYSRKVTLVDLYSDLCADGYTNTLDGVTLRDDGLHFTDDGARVVWKVLAPAVKKAADRAEAAATG